VGGVGKTTIGAKRAALLEYAFVDLDAEIESYFGTSIERMRRQCLTPYYFRKEASKALEQVVGREACQDAILDRIVFYDIGSRRLDRQPTEEERRLYLREIRKDVSYFGRTYRRAPTVDVVGLGSNDVARKLAAMVGASS
jgi:shikimate kinase